jgi:3-hydroxyacyl-CoA dehydrogenase/enoyl-CoA hydratase/3-hydroxybutyryl-CoA epimerase
MQELNKGARRPAGAPPTTLKKVGVLGAGFMGASVAYVTALAGIEVVLIDRDQESADKGKAHSHKLMTEQVNRGRASSAEREALLARIAPTADYGALKDCDLVIEAVFEDRKVKAEAMAKAEAVIGDKVIFGSNTSTLPISSLAEASKRPAQFIGVHFFSPVERMMLVEIILGKQTGDAALAVALDYVRAIRKTPIVVNDSRGFYANRCVLNYIREGHLMLMEGIPAAMIENVARMAGMPVGRCRSMTKSRSISAGKSSRPPRPISGPRRSIPSRKSCCRSWLKSAAGSAARTPRASTTIRRLGRSGCGRALPICKRRRSIPTESI